MKAISSGRNFINLVKFSKFSKSIFFAKTRSNVQKWCIIRKKLSFGIQFSIPSGWRKAAEQHQCWDLETIYGA
jgi:hypothetical protein